MTDISRIREARCRLMCLVETALDCPEQTDACELGEIVDMVRDLAEAERFLSPQADDDRDSAQIEGDIRAGRFNEIDAERMARAYDDYKTAKRYYTRVKSPESRRSMDEKADRHLRRVMDSIREVWREADVSQREKIKEDMTRLVEEM